MILRLETTAGQDFAEAADEAMIVAIQLDITVVFEANGVTVMISPNCMIFPDEIGRLIQEAIEKGRKILSV